MKLSFVIPLYNAEPYIRQCLDSVLNSDVDKSEYEVIVVDDGSKDNGLAIAREYEKQHTNIHVFHQENQGQSVARNFGIKHAKGKYIWFVDSDDYVNATHISPILQMMDEKKIEVCKFNMDVFDEKGNDWISNIPELKENYVYDGEAYFHTNCTIGSVCNSFFSKDFIIKNSLTFYPGIIHQDAEFSIRSTALAESIIYVNIALYIYRYNTESCTRSKSFNKLLKADVSDAIIAHNIHRFVGSNKLSEELKEHLNKYYSSLLKGRMYAYISKKGEFQHQLAMNFINKMQELGEYPLNIKTISFKDKIFVSLCNCKYIYLTFVRIRQNI